jgi:hypothetical protein
VYVGKPDLTVQFLGASPDPVTPVGLIVYTVRVVNPSAESCSRGWPEPICVTIGRPVTEVAVSFTLPPEASFQGYSADHGFWCPVNVHHGTITCTHGALDLDDSATLTIRAAAPITPGPFTINAVVDPFGTIGERSEANNTASFTATVR